MPKYLVDSLVTLNKVMARVWENNYSMLSSHHMYSGCCVDVADMSEFVPLFLTQRHLTQ